MASTYIALPADNGGGGGGPVTSFNGRTGAVIPLTGDYNASQITFTPAGNVSATNVQTAIEEVDAEKLTGALPSAQLFVGNASNVAQARALTGDVSITNTGVSTVLSIGGSSAANVNAATLAANAATFANTPNTIVKRDGSGNFSAGTITAALNGNATTSTSFTGSLAGDVTGPQSATVIAVGAVTDTKASLANKPSVAVVATTNQALSGVPTIDGQLTVAGTSVVLLTAQSTASQNGPWVVQAGAWTRPTWYPSGGTTQAFQFITTLVRLGTTYQGSTWRQTAAAPITIDTTATTWVVTPLALNSSTLTGQLPIANGGTASSTAQAARVALNIDERTTFSNANVTVVAADRYVAQIGTMSAPRVVTLPLASSVNAGQQLIIIDESGTVSTTNTLTINRAGADLINGATSSMIRTAFGRAVLYSDGVSKWTDAVIGVSRGGTGITTLPTNGQLLIGNSTTSAYTQATLTAGPGITITNGPGTIQVNNSSIGVGTLPSGLEGDGVDGSPTIAAPITLTRDMFYDSPTINAAVNTGGFVITWKGTMTIGAAGSFTRNGNAGGNSATTAAGAAGAALAGVTTGTGSAGAAGAAGQITNGSSGASSGAISGEGGTGGVGGNAGGGTGGVGGSGGNVGVLTPRYFRNVQSEWKYTAVGTYMPLGTGGAGGAGGGGDGVAGVGRGGGGGGSSAGGILLIGNIFVNNGSVSAVGGNGGNGGGTPPANVGGGAGGGGGGGGKIMILANTITTRGTLNVNGGAAGLGSAGGAGGTAGSNGAAGSAGFATSFEASTGTWTTTS